MESHTDYVASLRQRVLDDPRRVDLTAMPVYTIDDADTVETDDGLSIEPAGPDGLCPSSKLRARGIKCLPAWCVACANAPADRHPHAPPIRVLQRPAGRDPPTTPPKIRHAHGARPYCRSNGGGRQQ